MKIFILQLVVAYLLVAIPVMAEGQVELVSTQYLYTACMDAAYQDDTLYTRTFCRSFIQGAINAHVHLTSSYDVPGQFCLPAANVDNELAGIFIRYTQQNPIFFKKPAILTLFYALNSAFLCP